MDPPRMIKTHLPIHLVPPGFWENKCKVRLYLYNLTETRLLPQYC